LQNPSERGKKVRMGKKKTNPPTRANSTGDAKTNKEKAWAPVTFSVVSLVISVVSLGVSYSNFNEGRIANRIRVLPTLTFSWRSGEQTPDYELFTTNNGLGPAVVVWTRITRDGKLYTSFRELVSDGGVLTSSSAVTSIPVNKTYTLAPGEHRSYISVTSPNVTAGLALNKSTHWSVCYCSFYGQCWRMTDGAQRSDNSCINERFDPSTR